MILAMAAFLGGGAVLTGMLGLPLVLAPREKLILRQFRAQSRQEQIEASLRFEEEQARKRGGAAEKARGCRLSALRQGMLILVGALLFGSLSYAVTGLAWLSLGASLAGFALPAAWLGWMHGGRQKQMVLQVEEALEIMASVLRSGGGLPSALEIAARDAKDPLREELQKAVIEERLGVSHSAVMGRLAGRTGVAEMEMVSLAVELQQGGLAVNLPAVLTQTQENIRQQHAFAEEVAAITAENRVAAWVIALLPFVIVGILRQMSPDFIAPLFADPLGIAIFIVCSLAILGGIVWIMSMIKKVGEG